MWSCSFMPGMQYTIYPSGSRPNLEAICCYCNESLNRGSGKVKGPVLRDHLDLHHFRNCNQKLYFSAQHFRQHLQENHQINYDGTLFAGWTLLLSSSEQRKSAVFEPVGIANLQRSYTDPKKTSLKEQGKVKQVGSEPKLNFMDFSETPSVQRKKIQRKPSAQTMSETGTKLHEVRDSTVFLTRAATMDVMPSGATHPSQQAHASSAKQEQRGRRQQRKASHVCDLASPGLKFYRRRLDAARRNRLYIRDEAEGPLTPTSQRAFRKIPAGAFGGLVLHSSLLAATPARLTNSVDIYLLR